MINESRTIEDLRKERERLTEDLARLREGLKWQDGSRGIDLTEKYKSAVVKVEAALAALEDRMKAGEPEEDPEQRERREEFLRDYNERVATHAKAPAPQPQITRASWGEPMPDCVNRGW